MLAGALTSLQPGLDNKAGKTDCTDWMRPGRQR